MATLLEPAVGQVTLRHFSLEEYHWLIEHGFFHEDERVELIEGVLYQMSPKGLRHSACLTRMQRNFILAVGERAIVRTQEPITLPASSSEPEPDLVVAKWRDDDYLDHHPYPADVLLVVEIARSSLAYDQRVKVPLYAAAGIGEYWIANLVDDRIEVYRRPSGPAAAEAAYEERAFFGLGDVVAPRAFPDCALAVERLLPNAGGARPEED